MSARAATAVTPALALALLGLGCGGNTVGNLLQLPFSVGGANRPSAGPMTFTTARGWSVELDAAKLDVGPFYFNIDPPDTTNFRSGVVIVEGLRQVTVDVLNPGLVPVDGGAQGETGTAVAAEVDLLPPDLTITDRDVGGPADNASAYLSGVASSRDGTVQVPFRGWIVIDQALASDSTPLPWIQRVNGAECALSFTTASQQLTMRVNPATWFDKADFQQLLPAPVATDGGTADAGAPGGPYGWADTSDFEAAVLNQLQASSGVYDFELTSP